MNNDVIEQVRLLAPVVEAPSELARARQRRRLTDAAESALPAGGGAPSPPQSRRFRRWVPVSAAIVSLAVMGGGIAAAVTLLGPTPQQAKKIYQHYYPNNGTGHITGTRPTLNSELVLCDYRGADGLPTSVGEDFASAAPLATPLTAEMLVDACDTVSTTGAVVPSSVPAALCVTSQPSSVTDTPAGWPVVVFGAATCGSEGDSTVPAALLDQVNQRRAEEATIDAVPQSCPTEAQAVAWANQQVADLGLDWQVTARDGGPGGSCYLPFVQWWGPTGVPFVQVTASQQAGSAPGNPTTTLPPTSGTGNTRVANQGA